MLVGRVDINLSLILLASMVLVVIAGCSETKAPAPAPTSVAKNVEDGSNTDQDPKVEATSTSSDSSQTAVLTATPAPVAIRNTPVTEVQQDNFRLLVSDEQNAIGDFAHLWVEIDRVGLQQGGESGSWYEFEVPAEHRKVDLTTVIGDTAAEIVRTHVPPGRYSKVFIHVNEVKGELHSGDSTPVKLPSEKLQIVKPFEVQADSLSSFVFDITVIATGNGRSDVKYVLQPVIGESGADQRVKVEDKEHSDGHDADESVKTEDDESSEVHDAEGVAEHTDAVEDEEDTEVVREDSDDFGSSDDSPSSPDPLSDELFLILMTPEEDTVFVDSPTVGVSGMTVIDAAVSVNDDLVEVNADGMFEATASLEEGPNIIEVVVSSTTTGEEKSAVLTVFYLPEEDQES